MSSGSSRRLCLGPGCQQCGRRRAVVGPTKPGAGGPSLPRCIVGRVGGAERKPSLGILVEGYFWRRWVEERDQSPPRRPPERIFRRLLQTAPENLLAPFYHARETSTDQDSVHDTLFRVLLLIELTSVRSNSKCTDCDTRSRIKYCSISTATGG